MGRARAATGKRSKKRGGGARCKMDVMGVSEKNKTTFKGKRIIKKSFKTARSKSQKLLKGKATSNLIQASKDEALGKRLTSKDEALGKRKASKDEALGKRKTSKVETLGKRKRGHAPGTMEPASKKKATTTTGRVGRKTLLIQRKSCGRGGKEGYELVKESMVIWEHLRQHDNVPSRTLALEEMMTMAQGHFKELALKHDTARVVQSCLKFGTKEDRNVILSELKDHIVKLCKLRYAKFVVKSLLKYCTSEGRGHVIRAFYGQVRTLIRHAEASDVVEFAYNEYANRDQRAALVQEFYGSEFAVFKDLSSHGQVKGLGEMLSAHADKAKYILSHMRDSLLPLLEKVVVRHSIVHRALLDYLQHCNTEARVELIESIREHLASVLHTKDGSRLTMTCIWHGTTKDRKVMVKSLKGVVCKVCQEENGHLVLMALFDCVDDTVLLNKAILSEIKAGLEEVCASHYGRRVLLYLLAPRASRHFCPQFVQLLSPGDNNAHSKKPLEARKKELLKMMAPAVLTLAISHVLEWVRMKTHALLMLQMLLSLPGDLSSLHQPLLEALCGEEGVSLMDNSHTHWVLTQLVANDKSGGDQGFIGRLLMSADAECIRSWVQGSYRAAYLLCSVLDGSDDGCNWRKEKVREAIRPILGELADRSDKAHQTLCKKLEHDSNLPLPEE